MPREGAPESVLLQNDVFASVRHTMASMPVKYRQVITLIDIENFSYADVAQILDVPPGSVMHHISHARKSLRQSSDNPQSEDNKKAKLKVVR